RVKRQYAIRNWKVKSCKDGGGWKAGGTCGPPRTPLLVLIVVHSPRRHRRLLLLLGELRNEGFRGQKERRDRGRVLDREADHLGRVDDARLDQVLVPLGLGVEAR